MTERKKNYFIRFSTSQIIQHVLWGLSFIVLALTGLAHKYAESTFAAYVVFAFGGAEGRELAHRIAAFVWVFTGFSHIIYYSLFYYGEKKMKLEKKDWHDFKKNWDFLFGKSDEEPKFNRFSWSEKLEYWASWIGLFVMTMTGLLMFFAFPVMKFIPYAVIDWARIIHGWEAILAVAVIIEFHLYMTILRPKVFPMAKQWLTGTMTLEEMKDEHPLEIEEILRKGGGS